MIPNFPITKADILQADDILVLTLDHYRSEQ